MRLRKVCGLTFLNVTVAYSSLWRGASPPNRAEVIQYNPDPSAFNPAELLDPKTQKPEMWMKAISELQELKKKPSCSRLAASMLMNDCQLLEGVDVTTSEKIPVGIQGRLEDFINGYAASLAICDIEAAQGLIPEACEPFRETALLQSMRRSPGEALRITKTQIDKCMNGLISVPTSWTSWTSSRDRATLFCRASRIDIERDQLIVLHQSIAEILQSMIVDTRQELTKQRQELTEQNLATRSYFRDIVAQLASFKMGVSVAMTEFAEFVRNTKDSLHTSSKQAQEVQKFLKTIKETLSANNVEYVAIQNTALEVTSDLVMHSQTLRGMLIDVSMNVETMSSALYGLRARQEALDAQSNQALVFMQNLTETLQSACFMSDDYLTDMANLKEVTMELKSTIETASRSVSSWATPLHSLTGFLGISWPALILSPPMALLFGSYGLPPSLTRNFGLLLAGVPIAKLLTMASQFHVDSVHPRSFTHLQWQNASKPQASKLLAPPKSPSFPDSIFEIEQGLAIEV